MLKPKILFFLALCSLFSPQVGQADSTIPTKTVLGPNIYNWVNGSLGSGPSFTVAQDYSPDDLITISATGSIDFLAAGGAKFNAGGVGVSPVNLGQSSTRTDPSGRVVSNGGLVFWSASRGAVSPFVPDSSIGLGSSSPPTTISQTRRIGDVFASVAGFTGLNAGEQFQLRAVDSNTGNSGSWNIDLQFVPEPGSGWLLCLSGFLSLYRRRC